MARREQEQISERKRQIDMTLAKAPLDKGGRKKPRIVKLGRQPAVDQQTSINSRPLTYSPHRESSIDESSLLIEVVLSEQTLQAINAPICIPEGNPWHAAQMYVDANRLMPAAVRDAVQYVPSISAVPNQRTFIHVPLPAQASPHQHPLPSSPSPIPVSGQGHRISGSTEETQIT